jgi:hypothetical protein
VFEGHKIVSFSSLKYLKTASAAPAQLEKLTDGKLLCSDHFSSNKSVYLPCDQTLF